jgi:hypothetical protein
MINLFGSDLNGNDAVELANQCMFALAPRNDNMITKGLSIHFFFNLINFFIY